MELAGWKVCHVPRLDPLRKVRVEDGFSKLHIWNMTAYSRVMFMDSDILPTRDVGLMLERADLLMEPRSKEKGPRIIPSLTMGGGHGQMNTGLFIIRPDCEEYMWLINLHGKVSTDILMNYLIVVVVSYSFSE